MLARGVFHRLQNKEKFSKIFRFRTVTRPRWQVCPGLGSLADNVKPSFKIEIIHERALLAGGLHVVQVRVRLEA